MIESLAATSDLVARDVRIKALRAMPDQVVVRPFDPRPKERGGIQRVAYGEGEAPCTAYILDIGEEAAARCRLKKGDAITYSKFAGTELEVGDEQMLVLDMKDVLAELILDTVPGVVPGIISAG